MALRLGQAQEPEMLGLGEVALRLGRAEEPAMPGLGEELEVPKPQLPPPFALPFLPGGGQSSLVLFVLQPGVLLSFLLPTPPLTVRLG